LSVVRVFGIGATAADVVAVLRRGPSGWCHVGRWDIAARRYEPGSWLHGTLYPQRCDLSADGRYLCYFAFKGDSTWELGATYGPAGSVLAHLDEVQWADWAGGGELLTATTGGRLQIRDRVTLQVAWEHDLAPMVPDSGEPPAEARHW